MALTPPLAKRGRGDLKMLKIEFVTLIVNHVKKSIKKCETDGI